MTAGLHVDQLHNDVVRGVSLTIAPQETVAVSGTSGSGKTRLLRAIVDLDPASGDVFLNGKSRDAMPAPEWRQRVGLLPAEPAWWHDTVGAHFSNANLPNMLGQLGFDENVLGWSVERLSSGERQRLGLYRLLQNAPEVLLLDEPSANLDPANTALLEQVIADYQRQTQCPILWVSHDAGQRERVACRQLTLHQGRLLPP